MVFAALAVLCCLAPQARAGLHWQGTIGVSATWEISDSLGGQRGSATAHWDVDSVSPEGFGGRLLGYSGSWQDKYEMFASCAPDPGETKEIHESSGAGSRNAGEGSPFEQLGIDISPTSYQFTPLGTPLGTMLRTNVLCNGQSAEETVPDAHANTVYECTDARDDTSTLPRAGTHVSGTMSGTSCFSSGLWTLKYDLTVTCDDGSAPDAAWTCGPAGDPCANGQHGYVSRTWSARKPLRGVPDAHLFDFRVNVPFCFDGRRARVNGAAAFGTVDYGFDTGLLEALGFETRYDPTAEAVYASNDGTAELVGDFDVLFSWLRLVDKVGARKLLKDRIESRLERQISRYIVKYGFGNRFRRKIAIWLTHQQGAILHTADKRLAKIEPRFLRDAVKGFVMKKLERKLDKWLDHVRPFFSSHYASRHAAGEISARTVEAFFDLLDPKSELSLWTPMVKVVVLPDGKYSLTEEDDYKHPALFVRAEG